MSTNNPSGRSEPRSPCRLAVDLPIRGVPIGDQRAALDALVDAGFDSGWSGEANGNDALTTIAHAAAHHPDLDYATSIVNVYTRGPALLATGALTMAQLLPGRFTLGIGSSSRVIVEQWNGVPHVQPFRRVAECLALLDELLTTGRTTGEYTTFSIDGFRLPTVPEVPPRLGVGALGPRMQRLAAQRADWVQTGMLLPEDVGRVLENVRDVARTRPGRAEVHVGVRVALGEAEAVDVASRRHLAAYLTVDTYAAHQRWLGRGDAIEEMWARWYAGDRRGATTAIPDELVAGLVLTGSAEACAERLASFFEAGADGVTVLFAPADGVPADEVVTFLCSLARAVRVAVPR